MGSVIRKLVAASAFVVALLSGGLVRADTLRPIQGRIDAVAVVCHSADRTVSAGDVATLRSVLEDGIRNMNRLTRDAFQIRVDWRGTAAAAQRMAELDGTKGNNAAFARSCEGRIPAGSGRAPQMRILLIVPQAGTHGNTGWARFSPIANRGLTVAADRSNLRMGAGTMRYELGHALGLAHTKGVANDITALSAPDNYGSNHDAMGSNGPLLSPHDRERLGLYAVDDVFQVGASEAQCDAPCNGTRPPTTPAR